MSSHLTNGDFSFSFPHFLPFIVSFDVRPKNPLFLFSKNSHCPLLSHRTPRCGNPQDRHSKRVEELMPPIKLLKLLYMLSTPFDFPFVFCHPPFLFSFRFRSSQPVLCSPILNFCSSSVVTKTGDWYSTLPAG